MPDVMPDRMPEPVPGPVHVALGTLRERVQVPDRPDYAELVIRRLAERESVEREGAGKPRRLTIRPLVAAAVVLLVVAVATFSGPGRRAVADLLGLDGVRVVPISPSGPTPRSTIDVTSDFGERVTLAEARARVSFDIAVPATPGLEEPEKVFVHTGPGIESVTLVYRPGPALPEIRHSNIGLILSEYSGTAAPYFEKYVDARHPPTAVTVAGSPGLRFAGPQQVLIRDPSGVVHDEHPRASAPTLVWQAGEVTYRLEADIGTMRALDIASSLR